MYNQVALLSASPHSASNKKLGGVWKHSYIPVVHSCIYVTHTNQYYNIQTGMEGLSYSEMLFKALILLVNIIYKTICPYVPLP